ncbi:MAG TPA: hypothetical protein VFE78_04070, partial [Gemmataceae bacterium]|nr:hypothetical protein [Gemmataceae bacterium]
MSSRRFLHLLLPCLTFTALALPGRAEAPPDRPARVDRYGDPLPPGAVARLGTSRWRQPDQITVVALSRDGRLTAAVSFHRRIHLWETATGKRRALLMGHTQNVTALAFSADGKILASASWA